MTPEEFTKGRAEFIKACKKATLLETLGAVYDLDKVCDELLLQNARLNDEILGLKSAIQAAAEELRSNGREMPRKMAEELTALAKKDADALGEKSRANLQSVINLGVLANRKEQARNAINARHDKKGGYRDKKAQLLDIWATGKYKHYTTCARAEHEKLGIGYEAALGYLKGAPKHAEQAKWNKK